MPMNRSQRQRPSYYALRMGCGEQLGLSFNLPANMPQDPQCQRDVNKSRKGRKA